MSKKETEVAVKEETAVMTALTAEELAEMKNEYPVEQGFVKTYLPQLCILGRDVVENEGTKEQKIVQLKGTFFKKHKEMDEWISEYLEEQKTIEAIVVYNRYYLNNFDSATQKYTSSPSYDRPTDIVPLWKDGVEVGRGTRDELQKLYPAMTAKGKPTTGLKECRELFLLLEGKLYSMKLNASSSWDFSDYNKQYLVPSLITTLGAEIIDGALKYVKVTFRPTRDISQEEKSMVFAAIKSIKDGIALEKAHYGNNEPKDEAKVEGMNLEPLPPMDDIKGW